MQGEIGKRRSSFLQQGYRFHMHGLGEHVYRLDFFEGIAEAGENYCISGEGGGIAGNVNHAFRFHGGSSLQHVFAAAGTDGVHDDDVGAQAFLYEFRHELSCIGGMEFHVFHMVEIGISSGVFNGRFHDFNADHFFRYLTIKKEKVPIQQ